MLRWQLLGDVLRIAGWPLSFVLLAAGRGTVFAVNEVATMVIGVGMTALLVPRMGIAGAGIAYCAMYGAYLVSLNILARRHTWPVWDRKTLALWLLVAGCAGLALAVSAFSPTAAMAVSAICSAGLTLLALQLIHDALPAKFQRILNNAILRRRA
jgi:PST family polysaccharide transporter